MKKNIYDLVERYYVTSGKPGAFSNFAKIKKALKNDGYEHFSDAQIQSALNQVESYTKFKTRRKTLSRGITRRFTHVSGPYIWWQGDNLYLQKGFRPPFKFVTLFIDAFSRKIFGGALVKLKSKNVARIFENICEVENRQPEVVVTDRGREFLSEFSRMLAEKKIRQVFTNSSQVNKAYLAELSVKIVKKMLARIHSTGERNVVKALKGALESYNNSVQSELADLTPNQASRPENTGEIIRYRTDKRYELLRKYRKQFQRINTRFKLNQLVRIVQPKTAFTKESALSGPSSAEVYRIVKIIPSAPTFGYKLARISDEDIVVGTYTAEQLIEYY